MNAKKYGPCKNRLVSYTTSWKQKNKQNEEWREGREKKASLKQHGFSQDDNYPHKKSIVQEKISVCLDHSQSQFRTLAFEKSKAQTDLKYLNQTFQSSSESIFDLIQQELENQDLKSEEVKKFLKILYDRYEQEQADLTYSENRSILTPNNILSPYLEQQIGFLEKNYHNLKKRGEQLDELSKLDRTQQQYILDALQKIEKEQNLQLMNLDEFLHQE